MNSWFYLLMKTRLQKILARSGYGSRRSCEEIISAGRVQVNGVTAVLGGKADPAADEITVDGSPIRKPESLKYVALYKPVGVLSTVKTPGKRTTVRDLIPIPGRLYPVGRLDYESEGLVLMTNDGKLTNRLTHPRYEHQKEYRVLVKEHPEQQQLNAWRRGILLKSGEKTLPAEVWIKERDPQGTWMGVILREGKNRQLRQMAEATRLTVLRLIRVRIGSLQLGDLEPGKWRPLSLTEVTNLKQNSH